MAEYVYRYNLTPFLYRFGDPANQAEPIEREEFLYYVLEEVKFIIASRCGFRMSDFDTLFTTVNYGIPDFGALVKGSVKKELPLQIKRALTSLEPRFSDIGIECSVDEMHTLHITIQAKITKPLDSRHKITIHITPDRKIVGEIN